ncbi:prepilin peptidase [Alteromonas sediminis]|uniref:Prepilin leader peptidase/N-methyltransferase n=1 Tax=Alteromonas sediminis TaxID=2259342 RepID=A0A3N5Y3P5_9ALTE|nr:A24 family peptidase [Alteromonas sediminis]RPJ67960.1 prepilin peptidase [Alteromonas sediminis]
MTALFDALHSSPWLFCSVVFIVSLMVGSFLNVVIYRLPIMMERGWKAEFHAYFGEQDDPSSEKNELFNLAVPVSSCPQCGHKIRAWENIPVLSYLFLGGKCSSCKTPISIRYPIVELLTGLFSVWVAWYYGPSAQACIAIILTWLLIAMTGIDLDTMLLPDQLTLGALWIGLLASTQQLFVGPVDAILGATFGYLSLWSVYWLFKLVTGKEGMGFGDFKLLAALGAFVGWQGLPIIILLSSLVGAVVGITMMLVQAKDRNLAIPFGPYLAAAGWLALLYKDTITNYYFTQILGL